MAFLRKQFAQADGLPFSEVLSAEVLAEALQAAGVEEDERVYPAVVVFWMFLSQVCSADPACRAAVARLIAHRVAQGEKSCSSQTGGYCQARARLPERVFADCVRHTGETLEREAPADWRWKGRHVKIADGTTCSMPDTAANQAEWPQPASQAPGVGFPLMRVLAVFSLTVGAVLAMRFCRYMGKHQSELGLLRQLWDEFDPGDVLLTDRYLCSWFEIALLQARGVDVVMRLHQGRNADFRRGRRLGQKHHIVSWPKPSHRPDWMDEATYAALPDELVMRELCVQVTQRGFRTESMVVVTTLLDSEAYTAEDLAQLYRARWNAEIDLRSLKETMQMDVLRGKTPDIVRKEIWAHALAYNLIRTVIAQAASRHGLLPRTISFKGALQTVLAFQPHWSHVRSDQLARMWEELWKAIAAHQVGDRPDRVEPRARKRRPKPYKLLTQPRRQARMALCGNT